MTAPYVEVRDLRLAFGSAQVLDGVSLRVFPGEVVALVGESGSGKTTLIRTIQGLQRFDSGTVEIQGERATGRLRDDIQMVFQDPTGALNPRRTVYESVAEGLRVRGRLPDEAARVDRALATSGLRPPGRFAALYPHELSGGQRQRVVIAGAMITAPRLLLADEPVASLDASVRGEILGLLRDLVDRTGLSVLCVTHDLGLAWNIADRVAVMYLGRIVEVGPAEELLTAPQHPYTRALLSVVPEATGMAPEILSGEIPDPRRVPTGCRFHPRCPLLKSGTVDHLASRCTGEDPAIIPAGAFRDAACHAVKVHGPQVVTPGA